MDSNIPNDFKEYKKKDGTVLEGILVLYSRETKNCNFGKSVHPYFENSEILKLFFETWNAWSSKILKL